ncbi:non-ribosomal peptide synthetase [Streptomyces sp. NPDC051555]|uniref:non-ribosomal peptide synthetase n=1 Tax=Streptomyces sp. NPDC051555 TaxID=3365657 RepID=UPI0037BD356E
MTAEPMTRQHVDPTDAAPAAAASIAHGAPAAAPGAPGVLARYEEWVRSAPESPAVIDGEHRWTYAQLDADADALAAALADRVRPGDLVGVCLDRSAALVVTAVALARIGAVYLPLGPRPGERRINAVTEDLGVVCLIGDPAVLPRRQEDVELVELPLSGVGANAAASVVAAFAPVAPGARTAVPGTLYAVLTSGSTGRPKAVAVADPALAALLDWYRAETGLAPGDRQSLLIGVAFDPHLMELWGGLTSGAALVPAPDEVRWDPTALTGWWREAGVTVTVAATPMIEPLLDRPWPQDLPVRHLVVGGDRMRRRPGPDVTATVHNAYGPAEATVVTTTHAMRADDPDVHSDAAPPIGTPIAGVSVAVTDADGAVLARGEDGELRVGGSCLALGYLDPELTARRFTAPPAALAELDRMYRTGDRVRMAADGSIEFLGRLDDQVKISGVRIEPAEVEAAFEQDPAVRSAVVTAVRDAEGRTRLVAHVLPAGGAAPSPDELLAAVRAWLPEQAVPSAVRVVDAFPLDANGKVDRAVLREQAEEARVHAVTGAALPEGASADELLVLTTVRDLIGRPDIALDDNFSDAGGTSILVARLLEVLERETRVHLRAPELLRQPDLRAIAAVIDRRRATAQTAGS